MFPRVEQFLLLSLVPISIPALKLPTYIVPCNRTDPQLDDCVVKNGQEAIPMFINGDPKYRVPRLDPLEITELKVSQGSRQIGLHLTLSKANIHGLKNAIFKHSTTDFAKRTVEWDFAFPRVVLLGDYEVTGQVLILPITGKGDANITITNLKINYKYAWDIIKKNGKDYMNFTKSELLFDNGRTYFDLQNLFNGDRLLGENMNRFLNENWKEISRELGPALGDAIGEVFRLLLTNIASLVPFDNIYIR